MKDAAIVRLYWERIEQAIRESASKYGEYCGSIARNILFNWTDTEECVNDTWFHAWNAMPPHRPSMLRTFLGKITRNLAFDRYRKLHRDKRYMFVLRYWYADGIGEIAERFHMSENNVSVTLGRMRKKLKEYLTERGYRL